MNKIILASASPRRKELLSIFDVDFDIFTSNINEIVRSNEDPKQVSMSLAFQKALDVSSKFNSHEIVLAADTIVYKDNRILGKPKNSEDAMNMLKALNGSIHSVITGIALIEAGTNKKIVDYCETKVKFRQMSHEKIESYIRTGEYKDKAGSYAIQGYGSVLVEWIEGSYSNVVGLPIAKVDDLLGKHFGLKLL